ncbi:MAG: hypothetical protein ACOCRZ_05645 [Halothermotrichaceae bacterium]
MADDLNNNCYPPDERPGYNPPDERPCPCPDVTLDLMRRLAGRELNQIELYNYLVNRATARMQAQQMELVITDSRILRDLRNTEEDNLEVIRKIYRDITGEDIVPIRQEYVEPASYRMGLERAFFYEIDDIRLYREIWADLTDTMYRDQIFSIILDELTKVDRINFIYAREF